MTTPETTPVRVAPAPAPGEPVDTRGLLRLATAGSVDDGKSTLVGRLLHDSKNVLADQWDAVERVSQERGLTGADLALLTDGLRAEREQGITIDVAHRYFSTGTRNFVLADCPGHVQYTRNTVTGASTADVIVVLVDIRSGVLDQTRRHLAVAALLRVPHVVVVINKIDLVGHDQQRYLEVDAQVRELCSQLGITQVHTLPTSALDGDNVVNRSENTPWYDGPSLLDLLGEIPIDAAAEASEGFRLPVQYVLRPQSGAVDEAYEEYRGFAGRVSSGTVRTGDEVVVLPSGRRTTVVGIDVAGGEIAEAAIGRSVSVRLADDIDVARGDVIAAVDASEPVRELDAMVCWLAEVPLRARQRVLLKHGARTVPAIVTQLHGRLDLGSLRAETADAFDLNDIGRISLRLGQPLPLEDYGRSRAGGAFVLIDQQSGGTLAAGMVRTDGRDGEPGVPRLAIEWEI